jgi:hypothetical protein
VNVALEGAPSPFLGPAQMLELHKRSHQVAENKGFSILAFWLFKKKGEAIEVSKLFGWLPPALDQIRKNKPTSVHVRI